MPTLGASSARRVPLVPRRRAVRARNALAWAAAISAAIHIAVIAAMIITFPNKPPPEAAPTASVDVVFEPGSKAATKPVAKKGANRKAQSAAPRGARSPAPAQLAQAAPPLPPPPAPEPPPPVPVPPPPPKPLPPPVPRPVPVPKRAPKPAPKPVTPPKPMPVPKLKPLPHLPKIKLPPPAPAAPTAPISTAPPEMNLELPPLPEFTPLPLPQPPPPLPPPPSAKPQRLARHSARSGSFGGALSMNGLSFQGGGSRSGGFSHGMNLALPQATQPGSQSDLTVKGDVGTNWIAELEDWVNQRKYYPEMAGQQGEQGTVVIRFTVDRAGHVSQLEMVSPTGYALLDQAWLGLFRGANLPPFPQDAKSNTARITASMHFEIIR